MITGIAIENFKGIRDRVQLDFRPVTLLFGANSAGKSTVLHALQYLREIFERQNLNPDRTLDGGDQLDLGGFASLVHSASVSKEIGLCIRVNASERVWPTLEIAHLPEDEREVYEEIFAAPEEFSVDIRVAWSTLDSCPYVRSVGIVFDAVPIVKTVYQTGRATFELSLNLRHPSLTLLQDNGLLTNHFGVYFEELSSESVTSLEALLVGEAPKEELGDSDPLWYDMQLDGKSAWPSDVFAQPAFNTDSETGDKYLEQLLDDTLFRILKAPLEVVRLELEAFLYVGPLRRLPSRDHQPPRLMQRSRWASGIAAWDELYAGSDLLVDEVARWLGNEDCLDTGYAVERKQVLELDLSHPIVRRLYDGRAFDDVDCDERLELSRLPVKSRLIITNDSGSELSPHDIGTGISQVLPVVVAALGREEHLISVEQPELHLHPRVQAALADLFIEAIHNNKHHFLIETHSEHLILRLLRRIRETEVGKAPAGRTLRTDDLAIYYLKQEDGSSRALQIDVDVTGEFIQPWPDDFFEIDFYERFKTGDEG